MKLKLLLSMAMLTCATAQAAAPVRLNVAEHVTVYNCTENFTRIDSQGNAGLMQPNGTVQIVDYGNSFFALSTATSNVAFSTRLDAEPDSSGFRIAHPSKGITMGKGTGQGAGSYVYVGESALISWNCRQ